MCEKKCVKTQMLFIVINLLNYCVEWVCSLIFNLEDQYFQQLQE